jgi:hypothetical protein
LSADHSAITAATRKSELPDNRAFSHQLLAISKHQDADS